MSYEYVQRIRERVEPTLVHVDLDGEAITRSRAANALCVVKAMADITPRTSNVFSDRHTMRFAGERAVTVLARALAFGERADETAARTAVERAKHDAARLGLIALLNTPRSGESGDYLLLFTLDRGERWGPLEDDGEPRWNRRTKEGNAFPGTPWLLKARASGTGFAGDDESARARGKPVTRDGLSVEGSTQPNAESPSPVTDRSPSPVSQKPVTGVTEARHGCGPQDRTPEARERTENPMPQVPPSLTPVDDQPPAVNTSCPRSPATDTPPASAPLPRLRGPRVLRGLITDPLPGATPAPAADDERAHRALLDLIDAAEDGTLPRPAYLAASVPLFAALLTTPPPPLPEVLDHALDAIAATQHDAADTATHRERATVTTTNNDEDHDHGDRSTPRALAVST